MKGEREHGYKEPKETAALTGIMQPGTANKNGYMPSFKNVQPEALKPLLRQELKYERTCDEKETFLYVHVDNLQPGECVVYRVIQTVDGKITGGYTVITKKD